MYWNVNSEWHFMATLRHGLMKELEGDHHPQYFNEERLDEHLDNIDDLPPASEEYRGRIWVVPGGVGVSDTAYICVKDNTDTYVWAPL